MDQNIQWALQVAVIGMSTVFVMLSLVVVVSHLLVKAVNLIADEPTKIARPSRTPQIPSEHLVVLSSVVDHVTHGQGQLTSVQIHKSK